MILVADKERLVSKSDLDRHQRKGKLYADSLACLACQDTMIPGCQRQRKLVI